MTTTLVEATDRPATLLGTGKALSDYVKRVRSATSKQKLPRVVFDWETDIHPSRFGRNGVLISFFHPQVGAASVPVGFAHPDGETVTFEELHEITAPILESPNVGKIAHSSVFDIQVCRLHGIKVPFSELDFDTLVASWLVNPDPPHNLDALGTIYDTKHKKLMPSIKQLLKEHRVRQTSLLPIKALAWYAEGDCEATYDLVAPLQAEMERWQLLKNFAEEMAYREMFDAMEWTGAPLDRKRVSELHIQYMKRMKTLEKRIYKLAGEPFNIDSPVQLGRILFEKLGLQPLGLDGKPKLTKGGVKKPPQPSTAAEVLEVMSMNGVPIAKTLEEYRTCAKMDGTYLEPYLSRLEPTSRLHADFNQTGTRTGRPSSSNPNLYNIPRPDTDFGDDGLAIRSCFNAPLGHWAFSADYSQIELRLMAHFSEDVNMMEVFHKDGDIHKETAIACNTDRHGAKIINFGIIYGMMEYALSRKLRCSVEQAAMFLNRYHTRFPGVNYFRQQTRRYAERFGIIRTISGRLRRVDHINSLIPKEKRHAENIAINTPIQGSASDLIKRAQWEIFKHVAPRYDAHVTLQIYDELVGYCPKKAIKPFLKDVTEAMVSIMTLKVPIKVSANYGKSWDLCKG